MSVEERPVPTLPPTLDAEMPARVRAKDWSKTPLGSRETWSPALLQVVDLILSSGFPMALRWGPDFVLIYNDGYKPILGDKHPWALGLPAREAWSEVWPQIEPVHLEIVSGKRGALFAEDLLLRIKRRGGQWEDAHFTLSYSPTPDPSAPGGIGGILVTAVETTEAVHTRARMEQVNNRLAQMFEQGPSFMAMLEGPEHRIELANAGYMRLVGDRPVLGRTVAEALPDAVAQGHLTLLDDVFRSGEAFSSVGARFAVEATPGGPIIERFVDFIYQPVKDANGKVTGIFLEGVDVTARMLGEVRREALVRLTDELRTPEGLAEISYVAGEILGNALGVSRVGYGTVDPADDSFTVVRDWNAPGVTSIAGVLNLRDFGSFVEDLKAGRFIAIPDVRADERTASAAAALEGRSARSFVNVPVVENDETVAVLYVNHAEARHWSDGDLAFIREYAARVRTAIERERASEALRGSETRLRELNEQLERRVADALAERKLLADIVESTDAFIQVADLDFNLLAINRASAAEFERIFGVRPKAGDNMLNLLRDKPEHREAVRQTWQRALDGEEFTVVQEFGDLSLDRPYYEIKFNTLRDSTGQRIGAYQFVYDVTARLQSQALLERTQEALRQAQKMEAVGQLTGGIAHDFNNMLAVVISGIDIASRRLKRGEAGVEGLLENAREGATRAATLTQRLLAFSRQSPLEPKVLNLNELVSSMSDLLQRTLGERIELETALSGGLWRTHIDPNGMESAVVNLALNARDAMPDGGKLTIETANIFLDERYTANEPGLAPGQYVMVAVTDVGEGMSAAVLEKVFDPFFTTKPVGKGTGLGLSMVYGFAKQSGGNVRIYSEPGVGTTVKIYLPRHSGTAKDEAAVSRVPEIPAFATGSEIVLVVEDDDRVRQMSCEALKELGYRVHQASSGEEALKVFEAAGRIDIVFTDIVMPGMNGRQLVDALRRKAPDLKVLFTTGYTRNAVVHNGVLDANVALLPKPFTVEHLALKLRAVLDG